MTAYYEFYSDLDLILRSIEELADKCQTWWVEDEPFECDERSESSEIWYTLEDKLRDILDILNDEPFYSYNDETNLANE